jgi:hypothetical protein
MIKKLKKIYSLKFVTNFFGSKTTIFVSLGLHKGRPSYKRSPQLSKENIQHFKTAIFSLLNPGPDSEYGSGSTDLIESRSNTDSEP